MTHEGEEMKGILTTKELLDGLLICTYIPLRMNCNNGSDPLSFYPVQSQSQVLNLSNRNICKTNDYPINSFVLIRIRQQANSYTWLQYV